MILQNLAAEGAYVVIVSDALEILLFGALYLLPPVGS